MIQEAHNLLEDCVWTLITKVGIHGRNQTLTQAGQPPPLQAIMSTSGQLTWKAILTIQMRKRNPSYKEEKTNTNELEQITIGKNPL